MNILSYLTLYLFIGTASFLFVVDALKLKELRQKRGTPEAAQHVRDLLNSKSDLRVTIAYAMLLAFLPAMIVAEFFYDWE